MEIREPTWKEVTEVVKKARAASAPGPYKVYKKCPTLLRRLWKMMKIVWRKEGILPRWQAADGCFVPKEEKSQGLGQFRTISLLNVEGNIFISVLARRITTYMTTNEYVDTSAQKGGVPGFSGCEEHTSVVSQLTREAKVNSGDLTVVWLDLANAYGTVQHSLIGKALDQYHIQDKVKSIIRSYFGGIHLRFAVKDYVTSWQKLEKGIVTGCTISVVLFVMAMNMNIEAGKRETRDPLSRTNIRQPPGRGFVDDLTITATTHVQARWILTALEDTVPWARMKFKSTKSRCLILKRGRVTSQFSLLIQGVDITSIVGNPTKCLGKWFDDSLKDTNNSNKLEQQVCEGLRNIDKTGLSGKLKAWIFQHGLLPRLSWQLMVYEITLTTVEGIERKINKHLIRWLGVPQCFSST